MALPLDSDRPGRRSRGSADEPAWGPETPGPRIGPHELATDRPPAPCPLLSARERLVLHQLERGRTCDEIAAVLRIDAPTVKVTVERICARLGVYSVSDAVARARCEGWA